MGWLETTIVVLIVAAAAALAGRRLWRILTGREKACGSCPGGCRPRGPIDRGRPPKKRA